MAYSNLPIASPEPDQATDPSVHYVDLHFHSDNGLRHESIWTGDTNPLDRPIGQFALFALARADEQSPARRPQLPSFSRLVGMTVYRAGIHEIETPEHRTDHVLTADKLVSIAFVKKLGVYELAGYALGRSKVSSYGVTGMSIGDKYYSSVQHLGVTPKEKAKYPVGYATPSLSARGKDSDIWIALHNKSWSRTKQRNSFVEQLVTLEELNDTRK